MNMFGMNGEVRRPTCYVLVVPVMGAEAYGPFETHDDADLWASEQMPTGMLYTVIPVFDKIRV
jgi:hypothetical protein